MRLEAVAVGGKNGVEGRKRNGRTRREEPEADASEMASAQLSLVVTFAWLSTYRPRPPPRLPTVRRDAVGRGSHLDAALCPDRRLHSDLPVPRGHCSGTGRASPVLAVPVPGRRVTRASQLGCRARQPPTRELALSITAFVSALVPATGTTVGPAPTDR